MKLSRLITKLPHLLTAFVVISLVGCDPPDPNVNTSTSGRLVLFTDEIYAPLLKSLADTFMLRSPNAHVEIRSGSAREMVQRFLDFQFIDSTSRDTGAVAALVIGRHFLTDEEAKIAEAKFIRKEYPLGYDGIAVAVGGTTPMKYTTLEGLRRSLLSANPVGGLLDSTGSSEAVRFLMADQNSSTFQVVKRGLLADSTILAPVRYYSRSDSAVDRVASGEGIALVSWYASQRDTLRVRTLPLGFTDSTGRVHNPVIVHPTSLVTDAYPLKQPLMGYTFALDRSLAVGFLAWLSRSQDAQYYLAFKGGLQPVIKMRLVLSDPR